MPKLKPFDPDAFLEDQRTKDNPYATQPIGVLVKTYLDNQKQIGMRQFASRCHLSRTRLKAIMAEAEPTEAEIMAISQVFSEIVDKMNRQQPA